MSCKLSASISAGSCGWLSALSSSKRNMWCEFQGTLAVALSSSHGPPRCGRWWMVSFTMHTSVSSLQRVPLHRRALQTSMGGAHVMPFIHNTPKRKRSHLQCKTFTHMIGGKHLSRTSIAKGSVESTHKVQYRRPTDHRRPPAHTTPPIQIQLLRENLSTCSLQYHSLAKRVAHFRGGLGPTPCANPGSCTPYTGVVGERTEVRLHRTHA